MPTYLQDGVGISGGSALIGGTNASDNLILRTTSDATTGVFLVDRTNSEVIGITKTDS